MHKYDEADRLRRLGDLSVRGRTAFALLCATRLLPRYRLFHEKTLRGDPDTVEDLAERLWQHLTGLQMTREDLERALASCLDLTPKEDEGWDEQTQPYAEDAAAALAYAFRAAISGEAIEAVWASRRTYEAMDHLASGTYVDRIDHPAVQRELSRQIRDLAELRVLEESSDSQLIERLRQRAEQERRSEGD